MFKKHLLILKIDKREIVAGLVTDITNPTITNLQTFPWVEKTLTQTFKDIHSTYQTDHVRILLRESVAHVFSFAVDEKETHSRASIRSHLSEHIPEIIESIAWDYKVIDNFVVEDEGINKQVIQVIATDKLFINTIYTALKQTHFKIEAIVPVSTILARMSQEEPEPFSLIHVDEKTTRMILFRGIVLASQVTETATLGGSLSQLSTYTYDHFSIKPKKIILSNTPEEVNPVLLQTEHLEVIKRNYDPMVGIVTKTDLKGEDEEVLNIDPENKEQLVEELKPIATLIHSTATTANQALPINTVEPETIITGTSKLKSVTLAVLALFILLGIGSGIYFFKNNININQSFKFFQSLPEPTAIPVAATPVPTPELSQKDITIQILNGNGTPGIATDYQALIQDAEYKEITTGNADNYDYQDITIRLKAAKKDYFQIIKKDLESETTLAVVEGELLDEAFPADAVIIIGSSK